MGNYKRKTFSLIFSAATAAVLFVVGSLLRSGYLFIGDGELFVFRDGLLPFLFAIVFLYLFALCVCIVVIRLPSFDYISRIIAINLLIYCSFGFLLTFLRIPLYSRTLILTEFILSTGLVLTYFLLRNRLFPLRIGILGKKSTTSIPFSHAVKWMVVETGTQRQDIECDVIAARLHESLDEETLSYLAKLRQLGFYIYDQQSIRESLTGRVSLKDFDVSEIDKLNKVTTYATAKRTFDILMTLLLAPIIVIVGLVITVLIMIDSSGTIFFRQNRIGYKGRNFTMYKFRSMYMADGVATSKFASKNDQRITRIGRLLRRSRLDELPQFINVLTGDMSIIGPRPEQPDFVQRFETNIPHYGFRHIVRPGITGWAQIMHGYAADENQTRVKLEYDFFYIKYLSIWLETIIIAKTFKTLLVGDGAR